MCCVHVPFRCVRARFVCVHVPRERVAKGGNYTSPGEQRIIAVEWHDHTDGWKGRWKEKGWEGDWKRGANKKLDRVVSGEKLRGRRWRCRNTEWRRATATSTRSASFQRVVNTGKREARFNERTIRCLSIELDLQQEYIMHNYTDFQQGIRGWRMQITE